MKLSSGAHNSDGTVAATAAVSEGGGEDGDDDGEDNGNKDDTLIIASHVILNC